MKKSHSTIAKSAKAVPSILLLFSGGADGRLWPGQRPARRTGEAREGYQTMIMNTRAYARAGLIGNPSDGYFGKTIALSIRNFHAAITLYESPDLVIEPTDQDHSVFRSLQDLIDDVHCNGYYGGIRLIKAAIKRFGDYCAGQGCPLPERNFTVRYRSDIPRLVGMAGSSAIITATLRALMAFYGVDIPQPLQPNLILAVEKEELGIPAGLQDRVIQVYEGLVYMDFERHRFEREGHGLYEAMDPGLLPPIYVAYDPARAEGSEKTHNKVRALFERGDALVVRTLEEIAALAAGARDVLLAGRRHDLGALMNRNYDLRTRIMPILPGNAAMVAAARRVGASAKFAGSGGAIIGTYEDEAMYEALTRDLGALGCSVLKPQVTGP